MLRCMALARRAPVKPNKLLLFEGRGSSRSREAQNTERKTVWTVDPQGGPKRSKRKLHWGTSIIQ